MAVLLASTSLRCRPGRASDPGRAALVLDYRGDDPPVDLLHALRAAGWQTPAPLAPPADAVDWTRPDRDTGRAWTVRPYLVHEAVVVPGDRVPTEEATVAGLRRILGSWGITLDESETVRVDTLARTRPGNPEVLPAEVVAHDRAGTEAGPREGGGTPRSGGDVDPGPARTGTAEVVALPPPLAWSDDPAEQAPTDGAVGASTASDGSPDDRSDPLALRLVTASIRQASISAVIRALDEIGVLDDTVVRNAVGAGREGGRVVSFRGQTTVTMDPRLELQVVAPSNRIDLVVERIVQETHVGVPDDGIVWVL